MNLIDYAIPAGVLLLCLFGYIFYRQYKKTEEDERWKLIKVYLIIGLVSIAIFVSIRMINLPEKLFPNYYERQKATTPIEWPPLH